MRDAQTFDSYLSGGPPRYSIFVDCSTVAPTTTSELVSRAVDSGASAYIHHIVLPSQGGAVPARVQGAWNRHSNVHQESSRDAAWRSVMAAENI